MQKFKRIMRGIQGALIVASILQIVVGFSGLWRNVVRLDKIIPHTTNIQMLTAAYSWLLFLFFRLLSPLSAVPLVTLAGFGLYELGFPLVCIPLINLSYGFVTFSIVLRCIFILQVAKCIEIGLPEIILLLVFSQVRAPGNALLIISKRDLNQIYRFRCLSAVHS